MQVAKMKTLRQFATVPKVLPSTTAWYLADLGEARGRQELTTELILKLHSMSSGQIWDAGKYKDRDGDIIQKYPDGRERVRFRTLTAAQTPASTAELVQLWHECLRERWVHPLVALAGFNHEVGRYISLERLIEQNKERYYETLEESSQRWHQGEHDPWPYINYLLSILKSAYREFEERVGQTASPKGGKAGLVLDAVRRHAGEFRLADIERACPGVGREWIRHLLGEMRERGEVTVTGRGPGARWRLVANKGTTIK